MYAIIRLQFWLIMSVQKKHLHPIYMLTFLYFINGELNSPNFMQLEYDYIILIFPIILFPLTITIGNNLFMLNNNTEAWIILFS